MLTGLPDHGISVHTKLQLHSKVYALRWVSAILSSRKKKMFSFGNELRNSLISVHSEYNCEFGEDEEECNANGTNEEIIDGIRTECRSTGLHVMCPRTFICISNNWLW